MTTYQSPTLGEVTIFGRFGCASFRVTTLAGRLRIMLDDEILENAADAITDEDELWAMADYMRNEAQMPIGALA